MKSILQMMAVTLIMGAQIAGAESNWYTGDERCRPPKDDGTYSAPYDAREHPGDYPTFPGADKPGWFCSYQREDGVLVQHGTSLTPQQQWLAVWAAGANNMN
ncbi:hypothetical protein [Geomonas propionica]|uniref:Secreted protein n=1 Tax=Geomonas propionica TaxID=2798582 RepID=A0ABS0YPK1_9BACT|nr:hypothetical protein [Geomonas propionica]MBJ6799906.1 hypothetical protein [Geomonas propionica]